MTCLIAVALPLNTAAAAVALHLLRFDGGGGGESGSSGGSSAAALRAWRGSSSGGGSVGLSSGICRGAAGAPGLLIAGARTDWQK